MKPARYMDCHIIMEDRIRIYSIWRQTRKVMPRDARTIRLHFMCVHVLSVTFERATISRPYKALTEYQRTQYLTNVLIVFTR